MTTATYAFVMLDLALLDVPKHVHVLPDSDPEPRTARTHAAARAYTVYTIPYYRSRSPLPFTIVSFPRVSFDEPHHSPFLRNVPMFHVSMFYFDDSYEPRAHVRTYRHPI